jgi:hypothetical protein
MLFGLIPGPYRVARAFMPRRRTRRRCAPRRNQYETTPRQNVGWSGITATLVGALSLCEPRGGGFAVFCFVIAAACFAVASPPVWEWLNDDDTFTPPHEPPSGPAQPWQPQPAPLPDPDLVQTRSGHKPLNRELPADRPHPWRTWEG